MALDMGDNIACPGSIRHHRQLQAAFLARFPRLLCDPPDSQTSVRGWPSPRSWTRLAHCAALAEAAEASDAACALITTALVGEAAAAEFLAYLNGPDLPDRSLVVCR